MKTYPFSALFSRMKYITRWCLMRSTRPESLSEHTADTAMLAHALPDRQALHGHRRGPAARGRSHSGHLSRCTGDSDR